MEQRVEGATPRSFVARARELRRSRRPLVTEVDVVPGDSHVTVIEASAARPAVELRELWRAREMALVFAWRDVKVRYKQSLIGIGWAILQPLMMMIVFTLIFGKIAKIPSYGLPYQVFLYTGLLPWTFFSTALSQISSSVMANRALVQKVYFPRLILPISGLLVPAIDFFFSFVILVCIMAWYQVHVELTAVLAPLFLLLLAATALGVGAVFATIAARYRDVPYALPFLVTMWLYLSPVIYGTKALPHKVEVLSAFNPATAAISGFRWSITGTPPPTTLQLVLGVAMALLFIAVGFRIYRSWESRFADTI